MHPRCWCRIDWSGGKTADCSAMDLLDLWESIQFGPIEDEAATALRSPEAIAMGGPGPLSRLRFIVHLGVRLRRLLGFLGTSQCGGAG